VDWDEFFEDINWGKVIGLLVAGIIVIGAVIFVLLDWHRANSMKAVLQHDLEQARNFQRTWSSPSQDELNRLQNEKAKLRARIRATGEELPHKLDADEIEADIRRVAAETGVRLERLSPDVDRIEGYAMILPFNVTFASRSMEAASNFLAGLNDLPRPLSVDTEALSRGETMAITINFYAFDQEGWEIDNSCEFKSTIPDISYRDIDKIFIFKGMVRDLKAQVDQEAASLAGTKQKFTKACEMQTQVDRLETELEIIREYIK